MHEHLDALAASVQNRRSRAPALWIHWHTHESVDLLVGTTRVVCNPFGYARREENPRFDPAKDIILP